jgi:hypothetical protein
MKSIGNKHCQHLKWLIILCGHTQIWVVSQKLWHFFPRDLNCPSILIRRCPMWHYPMCCHYPMSYWSLNTHIYLIQSPILEFFSAMNSALHILHIYRLDFHLKKKILASNFEKILWSNKFFKVLPCGNYFLWKLRWHLLLMRPWALNLDYTTFPFLHFGKL